MSLQEQTFCCSITVHRSVKVLTPERNLQHLERKSCTRCCRNIVQVLHDIFSASLELHNTGRTRWTYKIQAKTWLSKHEQYQQWLQPIMAPKSEFTIFVNYFFNFTSIDRLTSPLLGCHILYQIISSSPPSPIGHPADPHII